MRVSTDTSPARHLHVVPDLVAAPVQPVQRRKASRKCRTQLCTCAHAREAHDHYRSGSDCGMCDCFRFDRSGPRFLLRA
jgi:hypothetical protein